MESNATGNAQRDALSNWSLFGRLLGLSWQYRSSCVRVLLLQLIILVLGLAGLSFIGLGIDYVHQQADPGSQTVVWPFGLAPPPSWAPMQIVFGLAGLIIAFALVRSVLNYLYLVELARLLQQQIVVHLRSQVYDKMQRLGFRFFDENASGSIINRVTRDVQATRMFIDGVLMQSLIMVLSLLMYLTYMFSIHVPLSLVCLVSTPVLAVLSARFSRRVRPAYMRSRTLIDNMVRVLSESVQGIRVIKAFAGEPEAIQRYREANDAVHDQNEWIFHRVTRFVPLIGFTTQVNLIILLACGGYLVVKGDLPLGAGLVVFAGLLQQFSMQVANVSGIANSMQESLSSARRVFEILDAPVEIQSPPGAVRLERAEGGIRFEDVTFSYRPGDPVLSDTTFSVAPGQCVAILGATGAGKTSLLSLIARFYDPDEGRVLLDGIDTRDLDLDDLRRNIGIVFQENFLFSNTVSANIAFGHPDATREQIEHAARIAAAHDFVMDLANGYDTVLGEDGVDLSGGQRQRLALARAVLLEPAILLLDDPTAAIDPETEADILDAMDSAMRGRTTFLVAHRLSTLRRADLVIVLSHGRIVEMGTHEELMQHDGHYQEAARLQAADQESLEFLEGAAGESARTGTDTDRGDQG